MRKALWLAAAIVALRASAAVPTPQEYLGFAPGADYKLADCEQIFGYFHKLAAASDRIRVERYGTSTLGKPMYVAFLSDAENLRRLDRYRDISRRLALGVAEPEEAAALEAEGRAIVWIDSGLHATEVAPAQHAPELAFRMVTGESPEIRRIRRNVILMQVPVINPDGLDWVAQWYRNNAGTPYELAPLPWLYQKYAGHDNNRDWFMLNLQETRASARLLFREWFPQIVYNQHQSPPFPARIFVPPYADPLNPHIPAAVMEGINRLGMAMKERFAREGKPGVLSYFGFDAWWNGGLRSVPAFHNMHGILTETALYGYATPGSYDASKFNRNFANGTPAREPSIFYERPWMGGKWTLRDAIDYMLTADFAILEEAAQRRQEFLRKSYEMASAAIEAGRRGDPYAYVLAPDQWDAGAALELLERLSFAGVEVRRASAAFRAEDKSYPQGTYWIPAAQPFRAYIMDLLEPQKYPELRTSANGPLKRPYDITGWTLNLQMGVAVDRIAKGFDAPAERVTEFRPQGAVSGRGPVFLLDHRENASFPATMFFLERGEPVRWLQDGAIAVESSYVENPARAENFARQFGVSVTLRDALPAKARFELRRPRVAIYQPWVANSDEGWTEWLLDRYRIPYSLIHNSDIRNGDLRRNYDSIILASQSLASILHGFRSGETAPHQEDPRPVMVQRPEYAGGIGAEGAANLQDFVRAGGTLIALDQAAELPIQLFPLPVRNVAASAPSAADRFYCPGSLLRIQAEPTQPLAFGMPRDAIAFSTGGGAFESTLAPGFESAQQAVVSSARFARQDLLASGWVSGEKSVLGKDILLEVRHGRGRVVLFGFRPQFRGQPHGTFRFLLNAIYLASAQPL